MSLAAFPILISKESPAIPTFNDAFGIVLLTKFCASDKKF